MVVVAEVVPEGDLTVDEAPHMAAVVATVRHPIFLGADIVVAIVREDLQAVGPDILIRITLVEIQYEGAGLQAASSSFIGYGDKN